MFLDKKISLDGLTILRFTHASSGGGGMERYLDDLDSTLLKRHSVQIVRIHAGNILVGLKKRSQCLGLGNLVTIPLDEGIEAMQEYASKEKIRRRDLSLVTKLFRDYIIYNPILYRALFRYLIVLRFPRRATYEFRNAREEANKIFNEYKVDLLVMHHIGGLDSAEVIAEARKRKIPFININHFANDRLTNISVREQLTFASGIAGVSTMGIPKRLKKIFVNLSDGIDTDLFDPANARALEIIDKLPIIIYPARIARVKGQCDLIKICAMLRDWGIRTKVVFAGRTDSSVYEEELKVLANRLQLADDILFKGQLDQEQLRDWFGMSSVMAFPTYHMEGLGRILIEAQSMKVPPVAYISGGTPDAIQHGKTGYLVPKGDIRCLALRLKELLMDEKIRRKMGDEGRMFVQNNFSIEELSNRHEKYYHQILQKTAIVGDRRN